MLHNQGLCSSKSCSIMCVSEKSEGALSMSLPVDW